MHWHSIYNLGFDKINSKCTQNKSWRTYIIALISLQTIFSLVYSKSILNCSNIRELFGAFITIVNAIFFLINKNKIVLKVTSELH